MVSALIAIFISLAMGGVAYLVTNSTLPTGTIKVSKRELLIGTAVSTAVLLIAAPLTEWIITWNKTRYFEYFNGYEVAATKEITVCERDGDCDHTYNCDPYITIETYTTTDSEGHVTTHTRPVTKYHDCPYVKQEFKYTVQTTLKDYDMGHGYAEDRTPWRSDEPVPASVPTGPPPLWLQAKARIDAGKPGGVTKTHAYKNFLLASDQTNLDEFSEDIEAYQNRGLLPEHTRNYDDPIFDEYKADKFTTAALGADMGAWNEALLRLNGYLGHDLQGDIHMAAVNADKVGDRDRYAQALFAHWKSQEFKKWAFPKNAIGVVVGVKDGTIVWARATGGLPVGNEALFTDIRNNLAGKKFDPDTIIGIPKKTPGVLTQTVFGTHKYQRPCMECIEEQKDGYEYLKSDIYVSSAQRFWIVFTALILSGAMWIAFLTIDDNFYGGYRW